MRSVSLTLLVCVLVLNNCARAPTRKAVEVQSVVRQCGLEGQIEFKEVSGKHLAISHLDQNADFKRFDCVLRGLNARGIDFGFIGREQINR
jgi:hypothetical protein